MLYEDFDESDMVSRGHCLAQELSYAAVASAHGEFGWAAKILRETP